MLSFPTAHFFILFYLFWTDLIKRIIFEIYKRFFASLRFAQNDVILSEAKNLLVLIGHYCKIMNYYLQN